MNVPKTSLEISHFPVMLNEVISICTPEKGGNILDCTFGGGGYSKAILEFSKTNVIALDRDKITIKKSEKIKKLFPKRFSFFHEKFSNIDKIISKKNNIDNIIFDLGLSSFQLKDMSRGFSFNSKEKINMNMGLAPTSAEEIINTYDYKNLNLIIKIFGDEKESSKIVKNIIKARSIKRITTVKELVEIIEKSKKKDYNKKINVSTKTFQALRIFVNKETTELINGITKAAELIKPGGKIIVISFHSIEDKIVKFFFSNYSTNKAKTSRYFPEATNDQEFLFENYKNFLVRPSEKEIIDNPPSRSAKLRYAIRSNHKFLNNKKLITKFQQFLELESLNA